MVTPVAFAPPPPRQQQAPEAVGTADKKSSTTSTALWVLGLLTASTAITVVACVPPPPAAGLHKNAYFLTISCFFFAGVAGVMSAVCMATTTTHLRDDRDTTWKKVMYALLAQLASVAGAFSTSTALGLLGLAAASTAMNLLCWGGRGHGGRDEGGWSSSQVTHQRPWVGPWLSE